MKLFRVAKPGFFTTVQDLGRYGYLKYGVPISGAMDEISLRLANMLVRNNPSDACLEMTLIGPELEALSNTHIAITGADITPIINGQDLQMWQTTSVKEGDVISFEKRRSGCRAYLSVRGGINVPSVLGSRSTYARGALGGIHGRQLKTEDIIEGFHSRTSDFKLSVPQRLIPTFTNEARVQVVQGPQTEYFTKSGVETLLSNSYTVTTEADRMGYRLEGPTIEHAQHGDTISDAIVPGVVQVPGAGKPIITMKDAQTTGGYPKIAAVISSDLHVLGQAKPNDIVCFHETTVSQAYQKLLNQKRKLQLIEAELQKQAS